jgi:hypothetical protein
MTSTTLVRSASLLSQVLLIWLSSASHLAAQVEVTIHGGVHAARLDRPERALEQPAKGISLQNGPGEATTLGLRLGVPLRGRLYLDGGIAWSRNASAQGSVGPGAPDFQTHTIFTSATVQARLTAPESRLDLRLGAGPAVILHQGTGTSLLTRQSDLGGLLSAAAAFSLDGRLGFHLEAQEYLFSSRFAQGYTPPLIGAPSQPAGERFRHELVLLAGLSWRLHD